MSVAQSLVGGNFSLYYQIKSHFIAIYCHSFFFLTLFIRFGLFLAVVVVVLLRHCLLIVPLLCFAFVCWFIVRHECVCFCITFEISDESLGFSDYNCLTFNDTAFDYMGESGHIVSFLLLSFVWLGIFYGPTSQQTRFFPLPPRIVLMYYVMFICIVHQY